MSPNMNLLEFCTANNFTENFAMDLLQSNGFVSDNCIELKDVADADAQGAINFLIEWKINQLPS